MNTAKDRHGVTLTDMGATLAPGATEDEWLEALRSISRNRTRDYFRLGDLLNAGAQEQRWRGKRDAYKKAADATGLKVKTLRQICWVARRVHPSVRTDGLRFDHFVRVAGLHHDNQKFFLKLAVDFNLTVAGLRKAIDKAKSEERRTSGDTGDDAETALEGYVQLPVTISEPEQPAAQKRFLNVVVKHSADSDDPPEPGKRFLEVNLVSDDATIETAYSELERMLQSRVRSESGKAVRRQWQKALRILRESHAAAKVVIG